MSKCIFTTMIYKGQLNAQKKPDTIKYRAKLHGD